MTEGILMCPVSGCGLPLIFSGGSYSCASGHSFDVSSKGSGYVNFMSGCGSPDSGDNSTMAAARHEFLNTGAFLPLAERVSVMLAGLAENGNKSFVTVDAGCGEGYYTCLFREALVKSGKSDISCFGFDLSKSSVITAAKRRTPVFFGVASVFALPLLSGTVDAVTSIFAPVAESEAYRILKPGGRLYVISPGAKHLTELKKLIYDDPRDNVPKAPERNGFCRKDETEVTFTTELISGIQVKALFCMTPYAYKTSADDALKLENISGLAITADFLINEYEKLS